jgi:uncharacterized repeat protein (TIGR03943 family)
VKRDDAGLLVAAVGLFALVVGLTDMINRYLRPSMKTWVVLAGLVLIGLGVAVLATGWWDRRYASPTHHLDGQDRTDDDHRHRYSWVGWLLAGPIAFAIVVNPGALGSYAVGRQTNTRSLASLDFDLEAHLRSHSYGGQSAELNVAQVKIAAADRDQAPLLAKTPVSVEGFVVNEGEPTGFLLARIMVGCCAGDGYPLAVEIRGYDGPPLDDDQWVRVRGTLDLRATEADQSADDLDRQVVLNAAAVEKIHQPSEPYLYPY